MNRQRKEQIRKDLEKYMKELDKINAYYDEKLGPHEPYVPTEQDRQRRNRYVRDVRQYNHEHPIRRFYVHRWADGSLTPWCVEGPEYYQTTGSIWPGSIYYDPSSDQSGPNDPAFTHVTAFSGRDAILQAEQLPEWEWHVKPRSRYWDLFEKIQEKNPNVEVYSV